MSSAIRQLRYSACIHQTIEAKIMKTLKVASLVLLISASLIGNAQADWRRHDNGPSPSYGHQRHYNPPPAHRPHNRHWGVPAAVIALTGLAIGAAAYNSYQPRPSYVYEAPPQPIAPAQGAGNWYFCNSAGSYYPYVQHCPEGWQAVAPPR